MVKNKLTADGFELSDGAVIEWPDDDGTIRRRDQFGNLEEIRTPQDQDYEDWLCLFPATQGHRKARQPRRNIKRRR